MPERSKFYDPKDKTFRELPISGDPDEVVKVGFRLTFHGRLYELLNDLTIPPGAPTVPGMTNKRQAIGQCKMVAQID